jgi:hypothetical protein
MANIYKEKRFIVLTEFFSQAYMQAKSKGAPVVEDPDPKGLRVPERRIDIQPAEDDEDPG